MDDLDRRALLAGAGTLGILAIAKSASAGSLSPPAGAVAATGHTLNETYDQVAVRRRPISDMATPGDPARMYRITQSGVYYLTQDIAPGAFAGNIIEIGAENVTLDLNGCVVGDLISNSPGTGVLAVGFRRNIAVVNGTVRHFARGIDLSSATYARVENVHAESCTAEGIIVGAYSRLHACVGEANAVANFSGNLHCTYTDCIARSAVSGGHGFYIGAMSQMQRCYAIGNANDGFGVNFNLTTGPVVYEQCSAMGNGNAGFRGLSSLIPGVARGCIASGNAGGFASCLCVACHAHANGGYGFSACHTHQCDATFNNGFAFSSCNIVDSCFANENPGGCIQTSASDNNPTLVTNSNFYGDGAVTAEVRGSAYFHGNMIFDSQTTPTNPTMSFNTTRVHWCDRNMIAHRFGTAVTGGGIDTMLTRNMIKGTNSLVSTASVAPTITEATIEGSAATNHLSNLTP